MEINRHSGKATLLKKHKKYPTYQLYAKVEGSHVDGESAFIICILETFDWMRERFGGQDKIPVEIDYPKPSGYSDVSLDSLKSFRSDNVEVSFIRGADFLWTVCITEPDQGLRLRSGEMREAVPGRIFKTNISYFLSGDEVYAGFKIECSQPVDWDNDCEVIRPKIVRSICSNPDIGLRQVAKLNGEYKIADSTKEFEKLLKLLNSSERQIPVLIFTEYMEDKKKINPFEKMEITSGEKSINIVPQIEKSVPEKNIGYKITYEAAEKLSADLITYAIIRFVPDKFFERLNEFIPEVEICKGDWIIFYPDNQKAEVIYSDRIINNYERTIASVDLKLRNYPKRKNINYGDILFYTDARVIETRGKDESLESANEKLEAALNEIETLESKIKEMEDYRNDEINTFEENKRLLRDIEENLENIEILNKKNALLKEENRKLSEINKNQKIKIEKYDKKCKDAMRFPTRAEDIIPWAEKEFEGYIKFHNRAKRELKNCKRAKHNVSDICSGIYYIAGYSRKIKSEIDREELDSMYRIDIKWEVSESGNEAIRNFPEDYLIKPEGRKANLELGLHIKHGIKNTDLVRIYFCWDKKEKVILIGSLPEHLKT